MSILIVEDDDFKYERIHEVLNAAGVSSFGRAASVSEAIGWVERVRSGTMILDMSLPSHPIRRGHESPTSLLSGGIEVIMHLCVRDIFLNVIVVTQYPEVEIENRLVAISNVYDEIRNQYNFSVKGVILYKDEMKEWETELIRALQE